MKLIWIAGSLLTSFLSIAVQAAPRSPLNTPFFESPGDIKDIALVVDGLITADIRGKFDGVYQSDYSKLMPLLLDGVRTAVADHGFNVVEFHGNAGLFAPHELKLVYADRGGGEEERVPFPFYERTPPAWAGEPTKQLLNSALEQVETKRRSTQLSVSVPEEIKRLPVQAIAILTISSLNVSVWKGMAIAIATGLPSALVTPPGGIYFYLLYKSGCTGTMTIVDTRSGAVLWHEIFTSDSARSTGGTQLVRNMSALLVNRLPRRKNDSSVDSETRAIASTISVVALSEDEFATKPSILADPNGWTTRDLKKAYKNGGISRAAFKGSIRKMRVEHAERMKRLDEDVKNGKIDKHERETEEIKLDWLLAGF